MDAVPEFTLLQLRELLATTVPVSGTSGAKLVVRVKTHPVPLSRTFTEYVPGNKFATAEAVCNVGVQVYVKGPMPPVAFTVADPRQAQVIEKVVNERFGLGRTVTVAETVD
jgi:hypothetical protein